MCDIGCPSIFKPRPSRSNLLECSSWGWTTRLSYDTGSGVKRSGCLGDARTMRSGVMTPKSKSGTTIAVAKKSLKVQIGAPRSGAGGQALPFSPAIRAGDFVYVSGQVAHDE